MYTRCACIQAPRLSKNIFIPKETCQLPTNFHFVVTYEGPFRNTQFGFTYQALRAIPWSPNIEYIGGRGQFFFEKKKKKINCLKVAQKGLFLMEYDLIDFLVLFLYYCNFFLRPKRYIENLGEIKKKKKKWKNEV